MRSLCLQITKRNLSHQISRDFQEIEEQFYFLRMAKQSIGALCAQMANVSRLLANETKVIQLRAETPTARTDAKPS
jgi:hypothetical protein